MILMIDVIQKEETVLVIADCFSNAPWFMLTIVKIILLQVSFLSIFFINVYITVLIFQH